MKRTPLAVALIVAALAGGAEGRGFVADRAETPGADVFAVTE